MSERPPVDERALLLLSLCCGNTSHNLYGAPIIACRECTDGTAVLSNAIQAAEQAGREERDREWLDSPYAAAAGKVFTKSEREACAVTAEPCHTGKYAAELIRKRSEAVDG